MNKELLETMLREKKSLRKIAQELNLSLSTIRYWKKKYKLKSFFHSFKSIKHKIKRTDLLKEEVLSIIDKSHCFSEVLRSLSVKINGASVRWIQKFIKDNNLCTKHFYETNENLLVAGIAVINKAKQEKFSSKDISNGTRKSSQKLKCFLDFWKIEEQCKECGISSWNGKTLKLDIDHIDGNPTNNKLENLQWLCPNCHRQKTMTQCWGF